MCTRDKKSATRPSQTVIAADDEEQSRLFLEKAREVGAEEDRSSADDLLRWMAKTPPLPRKRQK